MRPRAGSPRCAVTLPPGAALLPAFAVALSLAVTSAGCPSGRAPASPHLGASEENPVTFERLVNADLEPGNWLTYSGQYNGRRFSRLDQVSRKNVAGLRA